ncbi:MAG: hypothetical protein WCQ53_05330 [bacterium]
MKTITRTVAVMAITTLILASCMGGSKGRGTSVESLTTDVTTVADCDSLTTKIKDLEDKATALNGQTNYCTIVKNGMGEIVSWLVDVKKTPEKVCPAVNQLETSLAAIDTVLIASMNNLYTLNTADLIKANIFTANFKCSPADAGEAQDVFIRIFAKYLIADKATLFCPNARTESNMLAATTGAFVTDIKISSIPGYQVNQYTCATFDAEQQASEAQQQQYSN